MTRCATAQRSDTRNRNRRFQAGHAGSIPVARSTLEEQTVETVGRSSRRAVKGGGAARGNSCSPSGDRGPRGL